LRGEKPSHAFRFAALVTLLIVIISGAVESLVDNREFHSTTDVNERADGSHDVNAAIG